jgi:hypothetical protein
MGLMKPGNQKFRSCTTLKPHNVNTADTGTPEPNTKNWLNGFAIGLRERRTAVGHPTFLRA